MVIRFRKKFLVLSVCMLVLVCLAIGGVGYSLKPDHPVPVQADEGEHLLPVIMYHQLTDNPADAGPYVLTAQQFEADMRYIKSRGYTSVTTQQLIDYANRRGTLPDKPILITFDDGYESFVTYAQPVLNELDMYAVVSVIGAVSQTYTDTPDHTIRYSHLSWDGVGSLSHDPHVEIGNHTYNLHSLDHGRRGCRINPGEDSNAYKAMFTEDLSKTQELIAKSAGSAAKTFAYPFGLRCDEAEEVLREMGFQVVLTCAEHVNTITDQSTDWLYSLGRFNRPSGQNSEQFFRRILV